MIMPRRARVHRLGGELLGRHVGRRPGHAAAASPDHRLHRPGDAEIRQCQPTVSGAQDVGGLEVAVDDPGGVRGSEPTQDVERDGAHFVVGVGPAESIGQRAAGHVLHRQKRTVAMLDDVEHAAHVGVRDPARQPNLVPERVDAAARVGDDFDRDLFADGDVARPVHDAVSALPEHGQDLVAARDLLADLVAHDRRRPRPRVALGVGIELGVVGTTHSLPMYSRSAARPGTARNPGKWQHRPRRCTIVGSELCSLGHGTRPRIHRARPSGAPRSRSSRPSSTP
jgi:hypothetical protein